MKPKIIIAKHYVNNQFRNIAGGEVIVFAFALGEIEGEQLHYVIGEEIFDDYCDVHHPKFSPQ